MPRRPLRIPAFPQRGGPGSLAAGPVAAGLRHDGLPVQAQRLPPLRSIMRAHPQTSTASGSAFHDGTGKGKLPETAEAYPPVLSSVEILLFGLRRNAAPIFWPD